MGQVMNADVISPWSYSEFVFITCLQVFLHHIILGGYSHMVPCCWVGRSVQRGEAASLKPHTDSSGPVMCLWGSVFLSSFSSHAWHGRRGWMEQEAGCGRKKMTPTSPTLFVWNVAVSGVCMCVRPVTSSPTAPDYWMESMEAVCLYSVCLQYARQLIEKERNWRSVYTHLYL